MRTIFISAANYSRDVRIARIVLRAMGFSKKWSGQAFDCIYSVGTIMECGLNDDSPKVRFEVIS